MAEQYAPIAKDSSLNTTDLTPKNIADVLQDGLATLANSVKPTADEIPFDNTGTSLVSTDVEGAIKEIVTEQISTVDVAQGITPIRNVISKCGVITSLNFRVSRITPTATAWMNLGTIPAGFRPKRDLDFVCVNNETGSTYLFIVGRVLSNGEISVWGINGTNIIPYMSIVYQS